MTVQLTKEQAGLIHQREDEDEEPGEVTFQSRLRTSGTEPVRVGVGVGGGLIFCQSSNCVVHMVSTYIQSHYSVRGNLPRCGCSP